MDLSLQDEADYLCHEQYTVDTRDHEDHTFCGVMFSVSVQKLLPLQYIEVTSLWVRGYMGEMSVYVSPGGHEDKNEDPSKWQMCYKRSHKPSPQDLIELPLGTIDENDEEAKKRREREKQRRLAALQRHEERRLAAIQYHMARAAAERDEDDDENDDDEDDDEEESSPGSSLPADVRMGESIFDLEVGRTSEAGVVGGGEEEEGDEEEDEDDSDESDDDMDTSGEDVCEVSQKSIRIAPGETCGFYVHSRRPDDMALVYDNQKSDVTHADKFIKVLPGLAHLSNRPFSGRGWGWGSWRTRREFVGRVTYGCKYRLWQPHVHNRYPRKFREMVRTLLLVHASRDPNSTFWVMPSDCVLYILNMCHWEWAGELEEDEDLSEKDKEAVAVRSGRWGHDGYDY